MTPSVGRTPIAVVGAGFIAQYHIQVLQRIPWVEVVAIVDQDARRARQLGEAYAISHCFDSVQSLLEGTEVKLAHVLVPPAMHSKVTESLLKQGVGVFVEKPLATSARDCRKLVSLAARQEVPLGVNHNHLFHPGFLSLKEQLVKHELGRIDHVFACLHVPLRQLSARDFQHWMFQEPRNIVFEQGVHPFSQIHDLLGSVCSATTTCSGRRELMPGLPFYEDWQIALECERGPATVVLGFGKDFAEHWLHVIGQDGAARIDMLRSHPLSWRKTRWLDFYDQFENARKNAGRLMAAGTRNALGYVASTLRFRDRSDAFYLTMKESIWEFHKAVRSRRPVPSSGQDGQKVIEFCELVTEELPAATAPQPAARKTKARPKSGTILVTGATGFLGSHLVQRLRNEGHPVRVLVRNPLRLPESLRDLDLDVRLGDIADPAAVEDAVREVRAVYHLATGMADTWGEIERLMVGGCRTMAETCLKHDVQQLFFTSTTAVYNLGNDANAPPLTERDPADEHPENRNDYVRGKIAAEALLRRLHEEQSLPVTIFRPAVVVGQGGAIQHSGLGLWARDIHCTGWGRGRNPLPFVLVSDVVDAMVRALGNEKVQGVTYNLVGDVRISARDFVHQLRERTGRDFRFHPLPLPLFQGIEVFKWLIKKGFWRSDAQFPSYRDLQSRSLRRPLDNSKAKDELGWQPVADRARFLELAIDWIANQSKPSRAASGTFVSSVSGAANYAEKPLEELGANRPR